MNQIISKLTFPFDNQEYTKEKLIEKAAPFCKQNDSQNDIYASLIQAAVELTTKEAPKWEFIAANIYYQQFSEQLDTDLKELSIPNFYEKINYLTKENLYGSYILEQYSKEELEQFETYLDETRNQLFNYS